MSKQRSSGPHRRILARLCALALIAVMLLTSAYAGGALESGLAVESLATENLAAENLAPQNTAPAECTQAAQPSTAAASTTAAQSTAPTSTQASAGTTAGVSQTAAPTQQGATAGHTGPARAPQANPAPLAEEEPGYSLEIGSHKITNVTAFYPANSTSISTNNHWAIVGLYYAEQNAHILLPYDNKNAEQKLNTVTVNSQKFQANNFDNIPVTSSDVIFKDSQGHEIDFVSINNLSTIAGYFDINIGKIEIGNSFSLALDAGAGGWDISGVTVTLDLDYTITKQVAKGSSAGAGVTFAESVTVDRGDYVIYKITVANKGTLPLQEMLLKDILPKDVFVEGSIQMGVQDPETDVIPDWTSFDSDILFNDYSSPGESTRDVYITAQVKPDLDISTTTTYTNTATIDGMSMPTLEDSADIIVNAPEAGELRVTKTVTLENPLDTVPDTAFNFTLTYGGQEHPFILKDGASSTFSIPAGTTYTVQEAAAGGYITYVNSQQTNTATGTMAEGGSPVVAFVNQLSAKTISLNIKKTDADKNAPLQGAQFALYPAVEKDGEWVAEPDAEPITPSYSNGDNSTGEDGLATFSVQLGNYLLYEVKAPSGYRLLTDPVRITVADGKVTYYMAGNNEGQTVDIINLAVTVSVPNIKQDELPVAGGMGAIWFSAGGLALASAAALLYFKQRKKGEE